MARVSRETSSRLEVGSCENKKLTFAFCLFLLTYFSPPFAKGLVIMELSMVTRLFFFAMLSLSFFVSVFAIVHYTQSRTSNVRSTSQALQAYCRSQIVATFYHLIGGALVAKQVRDSRWRCVKIIKNVLC